MSLYGALFGGVSGLRAQSSKIGMVSDNIANVNTIGYKQASAAFQTLVVNSTSAGSYQTGGVRSSTQLNVSKQGLLQSTESATDIAISGGGFFVVKATPDFSTLSTPYYTRAGSFTQDSLGNFINAQGYYLQGWPLDREGRLPGQQGNLNTTSFTDLTSLKTVNVESASGSAQATSNVSIGANLKAGETVYPGQEGVFSLDTNNLTNRNQPADAILVGAEYGLANADGLRRGDTFTIQTGSGIVHTYDYGGFTTSRKVNTASTVGDSNVSNQQLVKLNANTQLKYGPTTTTFDVVIPNHNLVDGDKITLASLAGTGGFFGTTPIAELNTTHTITRVDANTVRVTVNTAYAGSPAAGATGTNDPFTADTRVSVFQGNILDATAPDGNFLQLTTTSKFTADALNFTIANETTGAVNFHYTSSAPNTLNGEFNSLSTLADAIDNVTGLAARVVDGRLVVSAENANESVTFTNTDAVGAADGSKRGIDWVKELGVSNVVAGGTSARFNSVQGLANIVNSQEGLSAAIDNPLASPTLHLSVDDPLTTISFTDATPVAANTSIVTGNTVTTTAGTYPANTDIPVTIQGTLPTGTIAGDVVYLSGINFSASPFPGTLPNGGPFTIASIDTVASPATFTINMQSPQAVTLASASTATTGSAAKVSVFGVNSQGSLLAHLGMGNNAAGLSLNGADYASVRSSGQLSPKYDPSGASGQNMASGDITAQFSRNIRVYDTLGTGHDIRESFIKIGTNTWAVEVHAIPASDITPAGNLVNGQIATGTIIFNGDGTLRSVSAGLLNDHAATWRNGSSSSSLSFNLGTAGQQFGTVGALSIGQADGLSQFDSGYNVNFANQNGAPVGQLVSVAIDKDGFVIASYSNGETQSLYKLPIADFANPDGLRAITGNVFTQTRESGEQNLREAGTNGTGTVVSAALEQSNVDLAEQLTDMIVAQRSYQANTKVIKTADELLEQLNNI